MLKIYFVAQCCTSIKLYVINWLACTIANLLQLFVCMWFDDVYMQVGHFDLFWLYSMNYYLIILIEGNPSVNLQGKANQGRFAYSFLFLYLPYWPLQHFFLKSFSEQVFLHPVCMT
jgi:hypothetical protein